jgi:hypothetical protein
MLMEANVLRNRYDRANTRPFVDVFSLLGSVPTERLLANITPRLSADTDPTIERRLGVHILDRDEHFTLQIRRGILRIREGKAEPGTPGIAVRTGDLVRYVLRAATAEESLESEKFETGDTDAARNFFKHIED